MHAINAESSPPPTRHYVRKYGLIFVAIAASFLAVIAYQIYTSRQAAHKAAATNAQNLARVLEFVLSADLGVAERTVSAMGTEIGLEAMNSKWVSRYRPQITRFLKSHVHDIESASALRIFDASGYLRYSSRDGDPPINISAQAFFQSLKNDFSNGTSISEVIVGHATGRLAIAIGKPIRDKEGSFLGAAITEIHLDVLRDKFSAIDIGMDGVVGLGRLDNGAMVLRYPGPNDVGNKFMLDSPFLKAIIENSPTGTMELVSHLDGIERIYGYRKVGGFPLYLAVGIAGSDYLAEWRRHSIETALAALLLLVVVAAYSFRLARAELWREKVAMEESETRNRFRSLFENSPAAQLIIEPDSLRILECNQTAADIYGLGREELCQACISDFDVAHDREALLAIQPRLRNEELIQFDTRLRRKDGEVRNVAVTVARWESSEGIRIHATQLDITARKAAEQRQSRLGRALRLLSDCNLSLVHAHDEPTLMAAICQFVVDCGGYLMAWIGYAEQDAGKSVRVIASAGDASGYLEDIRISWDETQETGRGPTGTAIRTGAIQINQNVRTNPAMGPWREAAIKRGYQSSIALPLSGRSQVLGALTVYSIEPDAFTPDEVALLDELAHNLAFGIESLRTRAAHVRAGEELRLTRERLQGLFDSITDAVFVHGVNADGKQGCFTEVNDVACARLGYSRAELLTMNPLDIDAPEYHADNERVIEHFAEHTSMIFERSHLTKDGRRIPVEISSSRFVLHGQQMFVSLARDISERKNAEQQRVESTRQLTRLSAHLERVREEERARIARELHDELGQLMTALKMDILLLSYVVPATESVRGKLDNMTTLVGVTMSAIHRISAALRPPMLDDLGLNAAVEWLVEEFEKRHRNVACTLVIGLDNRPIDGELATAAYRIIQESLTNIARHADASKIHIAVTLRDMQQLAISIQDNGRGLQNQYMQARKKTGFGLLGIRERINALGGSFTLHSMPGEGVSLDVTLPLQQSDSGSSAQ